MKKYLASFLTFSLLLAGVNVSAYGSDKPHCLSASQVKGITLHDTMKDNGSYVVYNETPSYFDGRFWWIFVGHIKVTSKDEAMDIARQHLQEATPPVYSDAKFVEGRKGTPDVWGCLYHTSQAHLDIAAVTPVTTGAKAANKKQLSVLQNRL